MIRVQCLGSRKVLLRQNRDITPHSNTQNWSSSRGIASHCPLARPMDVRSQQPSSCDPLPVASARSPATPANSISRRNRRNFGNRGHLLGAADPSKPPAISVSDSKSPHTNLSCEPMPSRRPARSRRRPFGVPSPCRKNEQEHCMFTREWRPRRPPASPLAAGESFPAPPSSSTSSHERPRAHARTTNPHQNIHP